jgi:succinyl-diaminopimelate desuccinylase
LILQETNMTAAQCAYELTRKLIGFDTINPPGDEEACARYLGDMLADAGFRVSYHPYGERRTSVVAAIGGADKAPLCITGHIDTVPLGAAAWRKDPFAGETDAGKLYGRGTSDMKSGVAAFVTAALEFRDRLAGTAGLELVITGGEETGCEGAFHLARSTGALGRAGAILVAEPTANYPLVGHKGAYWLTARTRGVTAHGSMPERGENAVYKAARAVARLEQFDFGIAPHALLGAPTLNVGTIAGGLNINSVPDQARVGIDIRTIAGQDHKALHATLANLLGQEVELEPILDVGSVYTDPSDPWMAEVFDIMTPLLGAQPEPRSVSYFTDAAALRPAYGNPPTVVLGPGEPQMAHQTDEYCVTDRIGQAVDAYSEIIRRWCNA